MQDHPINNNILVSECILIDENKQNIGKVNIQEAKRKAQEADLDLVMVSEKPAVCKILDYQKLVYENKKKIKHQQKTSKVESIKEIKFRANIAPHDLNIKIKKIKDLIKSGHKVKVSCQLSRRQQALKSNVMNIFKDIYEDVKVEDMPNDFVKDSGNFIQGLLC